MGVGEDIGDRVGLREGGVEEESEEEEGEKGKK